MSTFQGKRVSWAWKLALDAAERDGVEFRLNSGRRTLREQWALYRQNMSNGQARPGRPLTAYPNPTAPHIRVGLPNHALDVDTNVGEGEQELQNYLQRRGLRVGNPVSGEPWHMDADLASLLKLARRIRRKQRRRRRRRRGSS
jgi:hypothetical protein